MKGKELLERDDEDSSDSEEDGAKNQKDVIFFKVHWVRNIPWTQRQLISVTIQSKDSNNNWVSKNVFITKLLPGTRRQDLVGMRGRRDMDSINFIADDLYLIKFRSSVYSGI